MEIQQNLFWLGKDEEDDEKWRFFLFNLNLRKSPVKFERNSLEIEYNFPKKFIILSR